MTYPLPSAGPVNTFLYGPPLIAPAPPSFLTTIAPTDESVISKSVPDVSSESMTSVLPHYANFSSVLPFPKLDRILTNCVANSSSFLSSCAMSSTRLTRSSLILFSTPFPSNRCLDLSWTRPLLCLATLRLEIEAYERQIEGSSSNIARTWRECDRSALLIRRD